MRQLQERSAEKREQRRKEALERYSVNNFSDLFAVTDKALVRHRDGTFEALGKDVISAGLKDGTIKYRGRATTEYPRRGHRRRPCATAR